MGSEGRRQRSFLCLPAFVAGLGLALLVLPGSLAADPEADSRAAELVKLRSEIEQLEKRLGELRSRESGLEADLGRTRVELELQEKQLAEASAALALATLRADTAVQRIGELETALVHLRADLRRRLVGLYRLGRQGYLRLFLALNPNRDLLPAIRHLRFLVRRDQLDIELYRQTRDELAGERRHLENQRREAEQWRSREAERRDGLARLRRRQEDLLERLARERRQVTAKSDELQDKERKLVRLINSLVDGGDVLEGTPIDKFRGALDWPLRGRVTGHFGPRRDPRYKTEVPHNGIDLEPEGDGEVRAVFPGKVLFADRFEGYGLMAVVHHPGRVFTLYSGLSRLSVAKDDVVSLGTVVGTIADELYFEIRRENQAEDPLLWLR